MPLMPKRVKYRKQQRGRSRGLATSGNTLSFGEFGLQSLGRSYITNTQIEACRIAVNRNLKRRGKLWIRIFPDYPYTKKPLEVRMGKGKGNIDRWVAKVKPGRMLFELAGVPESQAREAFRLAAAKLPIRSRFITRNPHA
ncbi:MAG: 50S ribosomal protein L16 [Verrucomicrobia bacterium]|nr:50S ribosomal protein L16 [Verrucomicrobiota bacterium]MCH8528496.1 50S ribosomal protein L16 [Kiritimatiellia bacterium]